MMPQRHDPATGRYMSGAGAGKSVGGAHPLAKNAHREAASAPKSSIGIKSVAGKGGGHIPDMVSAFGGGAKGAMTSHAIGGTTVKMSSSGSAKVKGYSAKNYLGNFSVK